MDHDETTSGTAEADAEPEETPLEVLSESDCWLLLRSVDVGRIAMATADGVEIFPINFVVDHGTIVFRTAAGTKLTHVAKTTEISFEADDFDRTDGTAWSVVVKGRAETIQGRTDVFDAFEIDLSPWHQSNKPFFVRLEPRSTSGRRFVRSG